MSTSRSKAKPRAPAPRRRLTRDERRKQLLDVAWRLVRKEGTDALTLGRVAEESGVTKPVVYDHFVTRNGLLAALYEEYDARQTVLMEAALEASEPTLPSRASVIAAAYVDCVLQQGREIPGVVAALSSAPELEKLKRACDLAFMGKCRAALAPFARGSIVAPGLWAMLGAAESLSYAAATGVIGAEQAKDELVATIVAMVGRSASDSKVAARKTVAAKARRPRRAPR